VFAAQNEKQETSNEKQIGAVFTTQLGAENKKQETSNEKQIGVVFTTQLGA
jgi:hypothetical protein